MTTRTVKKVLGVGLVWAAITLAFCAVVIVLAGRLAHAHGDADWINKGGYRSKSGELCCGKDDCYELAPQRVHLGPEGYDLLDHDIRVPARQAIPSEDGKYWVCKVGARMRCFFAPLTGS